MTYLNFLPILGKVLFEVISYDQNAIDFIKRFPEGGVASFRSSHIYELYDTYDKEGRYEECDSSDEESSYTI